AGRHLPCADPRSAAAPDGRAFRRARCPHPRAAAARSAAHLANHAQDGGLRHPQHQRGGVSLRPRGGDDAAAGQGQGSAAHRSRKAAWSRGARQRGVQRERASHQPSVPGNGGDPMKSDVKNFLWTVASFALIVLAWDLVVRIFGIKPYLLPSPWLVLISILENWRTLGMHTLWTTGA